MYSYTKTQADNWEQLTLDGKGEYQALFVDPEEIGKLKLYNANARLVLSLISQYVNIDRDDLCDLAYRGICRCYTHYHKHPDKLDKYPFGTSSYLHIKGSLNQGVKMKTKGSVVYDSDQLYDSGIEDNIKYGVNLMDLVSMFNTPEDKLCYKNTIIGNMPIVEARELTGDTLIEYWDRMDNISVVLKTNHITNDW